MYPLKENCNAQQTELVRIILSSVPVDTIYLLGSTLMSRSTESIFITQSLPCQYVAHYYILALVHSSHNLNTLQDKIENNCRHFIPVTAIVLHTVQFNNWIMEGHPFVSIVCKNAALLHGEDNKRDISFKTPEPEFIQATQKSIYHEGLNKVTEFIAGAELYRLRAQNKMALFMLRQAAEHALHTILKMQAGLYTHTHNLDKLIRYGTMVSPHITEMLPRDNDKNERLFQLLSKACIDTGHKDGYSISAADLAIITDRVLGLQHIMKEISKERHWLFGQKI